MARVRWLLSSVWALAFASLAQPAEQWRAGEMPNGDGWYAAVRGVGDEVFGQYCYAKSEKCLWVLMNNTVCDPSGTYVAMVNADEAALGLPLLCSRANGLSRYAFSDFDALDHLVRHSRRIGIAFPVRDGEFKFSSFSVEMAPTAIDRMRALASGSSKKAQIAS